LVIVAPLSVTATRRLGTKTVVASNLTLNTAGLALLSQTTVHSGYPDALPYFVLIGIGVGLALAPSTQSIMRSLPRERAGVGSATSDTSMQVGGALGAAVPGHSP
jgi:predicted MFS family arabinose efflux permease